MLNKPGKLIIFSGPSGVGKRTVLNQLFFYTELNLVYSVSLTTRKPRLGERNGVDYFFVERSDFQTAINNNRLLEYAEFIGNLYGTLKDEVEAKLALGYNVVLEIEVKGSMQILKLIPEALSFFLLPPSIEVLESRIRNRKTEAEDIVRSRVAKAKREIDLAKFYDYKILNDNLDETVQKIKSILMQELDINEKTS